MLDFCIPVAIDVRYETIVSFRQARRQLPRPVSYNTLKSWALSGRKNKKGVMVRLEYIKHGREFCTSVEAYGRFVQKLGG